MTRRKNLIKILTVIIIILGVGLWFVRVARANHWTEFRDGNSYTAVPLAEGWDGLSRGGYASAVSVVQGGQIDFYISTDKLTYDLQIYHEGATRQLKQTVTGLSGVEYSCAEGYNPPGCNWPVAYTFTVPTDWPSGIYTVEIPTTSTTQYMVFWVREDNPGSTSKILLLSVVNTYQAYTNFGGKSVYDVDSSNSQRAFKVSFNRPFKTSGQGDFDLEKGLVVWAANKGYTMEYATDYDLHFNSTLLNPYQVLVLVGHSEYWSWAMRQGVKDFLNNGGRLINLSGNTIVVANSL